MRIRPLLEKDRSDWVALWHGYLTFYEATVSDEVTAATWERLLDETSPMFCLVAENEKGQVVGFTNCIVHLNTWTVQPICYLEDLFVAPEHRKQGAARKLIETVAEKAKEENWGRLYWMTKNSNHTARVLYDDVAKLTDFLRYDHPLTKP